MERDAGDVICVRDGSGIPVWFLAMGPRRERATGGSSFSRRRNHAENRTGYSGRPDPGLKKDRENEIEGTLFTFRFSLYLPGARPKLYL